MKIKTKYPRFESDFLENLLMCRGITDTSAYIKPDSSSLEDPHNLCNWEKGVSLIRETLEANGTIGLIVDPDCDGYTSATIIWQYLHRLNDNVQITYHIHSGKQHGISDMMDVLLEKKYSLLICPDSSSNDYPYHKELSVIGTKILVLDHHMADGEFSENAVIINNQLSPEYKNKELTGAGVVFQFCRLLDEEFDCNYANDYIDLAALGICGDMGSLINLENRFITSYGFNHLNNRMFIALADKQAYSMKYAVNYIGVAFYIVPLINAMIRVGTDEEKENLFSAFIKGDEKIPSKKRGAKGELERRCIESTRECTNAKNRQGGILDKAETAIEVKIYKEDLLSNKILVIALDDDLDFPSELNGLLAMRMSAKFKKPTLIGRVGSDGELRGSIRGINDSPLEDFRSFLLQSGLFDFVEGHPNAAGYGILEKRVDKLLEYSNKALEKVDFNEGAYEVDFYCQYDDVNLKQIIFETGMSDNLWGQSCPEPKICIDNIPLSLKDIEIIGQKKDTIKFTIKGVSYVYFKANGFIEKISEGEIPSHFYLTVIGKPNINEWGGRQAPQILIESVEIIENEYQF